MEVPKATRTQADVLKSLNDEGKGTWIQANGYFGLVNATVAGSIVNFNADQSGILMVAFFNTKTTEIRTFAAKYLDIAEREFLF